MNPDPRRVEALRLWRTIHTVSQIADRLDVGETTVRRWVSPSKPESRRKSTRFNCPRCGSALYREATAAVNCVPCRTAIRHERAALIERWWAEGRSWREIAEPFGWTRNQTTAEIAKLRELGYDLPLRQPRRTKPDG